MAQRLPALYLQGKACLPYTYRATLVYIETKLPYPATTTTTTTWAVPLGKAQMRQAALPRVRRSGLREGAGLLNGLQLVAVQLVPPVYAQRLGQGWPALEILAVASSS